MATIIDQLAPVIEGATQRDKIVISTRLGKGYSEIMQDQDLVLLAVAWLKTKHDKGGGDWDKLLDLTDTQLLELLGIDPDAVDGEDPAEGKDDEPSAES